MARKVPIWPRTSTRCKLLWLTDGSQQGNQSLLQQWGEVVGSTPVALEVLQACLVGKNRKLPWPAVLRFEAWRMGFVPHFTSRILLREGQRDHLPHINFCLLDSSWECRGPLSVLGTRWQKPARLVIFSFIQTLQLESHARAMRCIKPKGHLGQRRTSRTRPMVLRRARPPFWRSHTKLYHRTKEHSLQGRRPRSGGRPADTLHTPRKPPCPSSGEPPASARKHLRRGDTA